MLRRLFRQLFYMIVFFLGMAIDATAQDTDADQPNDWAAFSGEVQTRLGKVRLGSMPDTIPFDHPRFYNDVQTGRFDTWLGPKLDAPNSRFRPAPDRPSLLPSDFLSEKPKKTEPIGSANTANTLAPTDTPSASVLKPARQPVQRLPGFFERPGIMDGNIDSATGVPEESLIRPSTNSRWFRDLGRRSDGLPGLAPRPVEGGEATAVGPELLQSSPQTQIPIPNEAMTTARNRAESQRRFEQKLEGMLLSDPSVHFLSPVQVSFQNGVASVRGIVPNKDFKIAAGNVLLTDPAVKQVNNLISIVPADPLQLPEPIDPK